MSALVYGANLHANGIRQHYLRYGGSGRPLVLVPGITSPAITWGFVAERLATRFDVHLLDVRGRGLSASGPGLDYGADACADDIIAFIDARGLKDVVLLGHSMGARLAARALKRGANGLSQLVMVDPPVSGPGRREYPSKLAWYVDSIAACQRGADGETMRRFCPSWSDEQLRLRAEWLHTCYAPAIVTAFEDFHRDDFHADLPALTVPAMLMVAGRGGVIERADEEEIAALVPGIHIARVEKAGHMIPWDDLEGFLAALGAGFGLTFPAASEARR